MSQAYRWLLGASLLVCAPLRGQVQADQPQPAASFESEKLRKNIVFIGGGAGLPGGDLRRYMSTTALVEIGYAYRVWRYVQADAGFIAMPSAAGHHYSLPTYVGDVQTGEIHVNDNEYFVPFGARAVIPFAADRLEVFAGGGAVYIRYQEEPEAQSASCTDIYQTCVTTPPCPQCTSRDGWGGYGLGGFSFALDRKHRAWIDAQTRFIKGNSSGVFLTGGAPIDTHDQWMNFSMNIGWRF